MIFAPMPTGIRDIVALIARVAVGGYLILHAWQKLFEWGPSGVADNFANMGVPMPTLSAWIAIFVEGVGGIMLILGALQAIVSIGVALVMAGAGYFAHSGGEVFASDGGPELVIVIAAAALLVGALGSGRFSVDALLASRKADPAGVAKA